MADREYSDETARAVRWTLDRLVERFLTSPEHDALAKLCFYLSAYLESNRQEYYDRLLAVSAQGDWTGWCRFFLTALRVCKEITFTIMRANDVFHLSIDTESEKVVSFQALIAQARANTAKAHGILDLYDTSIKRVQKLSHSKFTPQAVEFLFQRAIFQTTSFIKEAGMPPATARLFLSQLSEGGVIRTLNEASGRRSCASRSCSTSPRARRRFESRLFAPSRFVSSERAVH